MKDFRVLFQYLDNEGNPHFEFTTVLSETPEEASIVIQSAHSSDISLAIVQVVEANDAPTGFTDEQSLAAIHTAEARELLRAEGAH